MKRFSVLSLVLLTIGMLATVANAEPTVTKTYLGDTTGTVSKVGKDSITLKVQTVVQSGTTRQKVGNRTINVPKYTTKQVETTYTLASDATVKTADGKTAAMDDVTTGETVRLHLYQITQKQPGEKPVTSVEVRRIDVPTPPKK